MNSIAVYVHIPFCPSKCGYCDFNSYGMGGDGKPGLENSLIDRTVKAIINEINSSPLKGMPASSIFFGGGTPTYLSASDLKLILEAVKEVHPPRDLIEITSEANPGTTDQQKFNEMLETGFNRLSIGVQSFDDNELLRLGRVHNSSEAERALGLARQAGFKNINLDLMFALPQQGLFQWKRNLTKAIELNPEHLSLYCLTIEPRTEFHKLHASGKLTQPSDEDQIKMFDLTRSLTEKSGYHQYEISNFAKTGFKCAHNLSYWLGQPYAGYGPGAVGCVQTVAGKLRSMNLRHPRRYCEAVENNISRSKSLEDGGCTHSSPELKIGNEFLKCETEILSDIELKTEQIMLGLRLNQGIDLRAAGVDNSKASLVVKRGWAIQSGDQLCLTNEGQNFCSEVTVLLM